jgi:hypothetical protein
MAPLANANYRSLRTFYRRIYQELNNHNHRSIPVFDPLLLGALQLVLPFLQGGVYKHLLDHLENRQIFKVKSTQEVSASLVIF